MRIVFMGTPDFAVPALEALHESGHEVVAVYTQPPRPAGRGQKETPSPIHNLALGYGIPVYHPTSLKTAEAQKEFASHNADIAVVVAYGLLLPTPILEAYPLGCINIHPSLLPRWRGAAPIQRMLMAGDTETGICIMQMDVGLDTGDILLQETGIFTAGFDAGDMHGILSQQAAPLLLETLKGLQEKTITPVKQSEDGVTYAKKITKEECKIDWSQPAETIHHQIRGLSPAPAAYFTYNNENIKIFSSSFSTMQHKMQPGNVMDNHLVVACGEGVLTIEELQRPGKKRMFASEMLKAYPIESGTILE